MTIGLFDRVRALLALPAKASRSFEAVEEAVRRIDARAEKARQADREATSRALGRLREDVDDRFQRIHLQLERIAALADPQARRQTTGERLPLQIETPAPAPADPRDAGGSSEWISLPICGACGSRERTVVCAWNKLALLDSAPDERAWRYNFAVCHRCGLMYATERPVGRRYRYLAEHFEDVVDKVDKEGSNPLLNSRPLSSADQERYRRLIAAGVFVSDHAPVPYLAGVLKDRMDNAHHVDLLGSLLDLRGKRVLEIRSRAGTISEGLRRLHGADVCALPMFESQQFILRELYGLTTGPVIDFESFSVPFEGSFDLILANHAFNHAVHLDAFLTTIREALSAGGYLYLYNEIDDGEFLDGNQSMIATMNPLHLQACDSRSLVRALAARGFEPVFLKVRNKRQLYLVRKTDSPTWTPIGDDELRNRIERYERARDRAVLKSPPAVRPRFAVEWPATLERAVKSGIAVVDGSGSVRLTK